MRPDVSGKIIEKFKEIISLKDEQCDHQCNECLLSEIIKEIWYECDYGQEVRDASKTFKRVRQYTLDGKFIAEYASVKEACVALGKNPRSPLISYACRGKCTSNNVNTAYGYKWSYAE